MTTEQRRKAFLKALSELSTHYSIYIGGCGCCGSPFLDDYQDKHAPTLEGLDWNSELGQYEGR